MELPTQNPSAPSNEVSGDYNYITLAGTCNVTSDSMDSTTIGMPSQLPWLEFDCPCCEKPIRCDGYPKAWDHVVCCRLRRLGLMKE